MLFGAGHGHFPPPPPYFARAVRDVFAGNEGEFMGHPPPHKWAWGRAAWGKQRLSARGGSNF